MSPAWLGSAFCLFLAKASTFRRVIDITLAPGTLGYSTASARQSGRRFASTSATASRMA
jgi:hypothetical protein